MSRFDEDIPFEDEYIEYLKKRENQAEISENSNVEEKNNLNIFLDICHHSFNLEEAERIGNLEEEMCQED